MAPHQQRVADEKTDLNDKVEKLATFFGTALFAGLPEIERMRLYAQHRVMVSYSSILSERIAAFV